MRSTTTKCIAKDNGYNGSNRNNFKCYSKNMKYEKDQDTMDFTVEFALYVAFQF